MFLQNKKNENDSKPEMTPKLELIPPPPPPTGRRGEIPDLPDKNDVPPIQNMSSNSVSENTLQYNQSTNTDTPGFNNIPPPDNLPPPPPKIED
jgi:hypothetical protein